MQDFFFPYFILRFFSPFQLMGLDECKEVDEECLKRRMISEAHLDYIYTQRHKPYKSGNTSPWTNHAVLMGYLVYMNMAHQTLWCDKLEYVYNIMEYVMWSCYQVMLAGMM